MNKAGAERLPPFSSSEIKDHSDGQPTLVPWDVVLARTDKRTIDALRDFQDEIRAEMDKLKLNKGE